MPCKIVIGIPTVGRALILRDTLHELSRQTRKPDGILVCGVTGDDFLGVDVNLPNLEFILCNTGLTKQRNAIINRSSIGDILIFFDDDFLPDCNYLAEIEYYMNKDKSIVVATGLVLADGIGGPGLTPDQGRKILSANERSTSKVLPVFAGYGCNMAIRMAVAKRHAQVFDERLPLYGWQEDVDFSRRLAPFGKIVRLEAAKGVHLGVKVGRGSGVRLGYSQVINPLYLWNRKNGYPLKRAVGHLGSNMLLNLFRSVWPEPYVDRWGRLRGNCIAIIDLILGRLTPERAIDL